MASAAQLPRGIPATRWRGESLSGKTIFLHAEQGFGDTILAARWRPATARTWRPCDSLECRPELKSLFFVCQVRRCGDRLWRTNSAVRLLHVVDQRVAGILEVTLETIPNRVPYLSAPPGEKLPVANPKIGLVWAGNPGHNDDAQRSIRLEELMSILQTPGKSFYSAFAAACART